ncbi:hypothetical protein V5799_009610 [Amblyomma americanum]|uniref:Uncharacterized protein n=1 Tax=Amblyomma americanum TaxID=6943 RepID=A0AAQ4FB76_AMBAM
MSSKADDFKEDLRGRGSVAHGNRRLPLSPPIPHSPPPPPLPLRPLSAFTGQVFLVARNAADCAASSTTTTKADVAARDAAGPVSYAYCVREHTVASAFPQGP